jgi:hypothetical protein
MIAELRVTPIGPAHDFARLIAEVLRVVWPAPLASTSCTRWGQRSKETSTTS